MISMKWVSDYIDIKNEDLNLLAEKVTKAGINVEHVINNNIENLVVGQIKEVKDHPDSDHLHVCMVDIKEDVIQIVCGAPNVRKDLKVIVALPGAILPGDFEIKKGKIRGIESNGMICALFELGLEEKTEENYNKGIEELDDDAPVGMDAFEYLGVKDTLYDLDVHKHKNNDCNYHIGFAYEVGTILGKKVNLPEDKYESISESIKDNFKIKISTDKCTYYKAKMVKDLEIKESPEFIKQRLISAGMRPINNVVDISNFVMLEYGQPLHFFDKSKLNGMIEVRCAKENEEIVTLDNKERVLSEEDIVITNGENPIAVAGVMGGLNTDVDENTKEIIIESAIFNSTSIRKTEKRLNLRTEASIRYEKGLNFEYTDLAIERACYLLNKYASGKVLEDTLEHDTVDKTEKKIEFKTEKVNSLLGINMTDEDVKNELNKLDFPFDYKNETFIVSIPRRRLDIEENVSDIAEELGRLYGYHNLQNSLPVLEIRKGELSSPIKLKRLVSNRLRSLFLDEVRTYTIVKEKDADMFNKDKKKIEIPNPMSKEKTHLRTSLVPGLIDVINYNKTRGLKNINIYEVGKVFFDDFKEENYLAGALYGNYIDNTWNKSLEVDFYVLKGIVENLLDYMGFKNRYSFEETKIDNMHPYICVNIMLDRKVIGYMGKIHPNIEKDIYVFEINLESLNNKIKPNKFKPQTKYPVVKKDLAFIVSKDTSNADIEKVIKHAGSRLLTNIEVFDVYEGENVKENEKSIAYSLTFSIIDRTLTTEEVMEVFNRIIEEVETKCNAKLRNM